MTPYSTRLHELIEILRAGKRFYQLAALKVGDRCVSTLYHDMSTTRAAVLSDLAAVVRLPQEASDAGMPATIALRRIYSESLSLLTAHPEIVYVSQLEPAEDRLLNALDAAIDESATPELSEILRLHVPMVRRMHQLMRRQKQLRAA